MARPDWGVSMPGRPSWWIPAICITTRGCGSPRSGPSRLDCRGGWERISSTGTCWTAMRRPGQKIVLQRQLSDLRMQSLYVDRRFRLRSWGLAKDPVGTLQKLIAPLLDLVRMHVETLRQLDQGLLTLDRGYRNFRLECRAVVPARSSCHGHRLARSIMPLLRGKSTCPTCSDFPNHLCLHGTGDKIPVGHEGGSGSRARFLPGSNGRRVSWQVAIQPP